MTCRDCAPICPECDSPMVRIDGRVRCACRLERALREIRDVYAPTSQQALHKATGIASDALCPEPATDTEGEG